MPIHIEGIEQAIEVYDRLDTILFGPQVIQIFQVGGDAVADRARELVHKDSGLTEQAIFAKAYAKDTVPYVIVGVETHEPAHGHLVVPYAGFEEWGTKKWVGSPYLRPAAESMETTLLDLIGTALDVLIQSSAR